MRIIKKLILYTTITGALLFSVLVVFGFLFQDQIIRSLQGELNKHLNAEIQVGEIELSFISNFPLASVILNDAVGFESKNFSANPDTLFVFESFELSFNILDVVDGNYVLSELSAQQGFLNLKVAKSGEENYLIFDSNPKDSSSFSLNLESVHLQNVAIGFKDYGSTDGYRCYFNNAIAKGSFTDTQIDVALFGTIHVKQLELENNWYLTHEKARVDIGIAMNLETGSFQISRGFLTLRENFKFEVKGKTNSNLFHYTFDAKNLDVAKVRTLVPERHLNVLKAYNLDGDLDVFVELKRLSTKKYPSITGKFKASDGNLVYTKTGESVQIKLAVGTFDLGRYAAATSTQVDVTAFTLSTKEASVKGTLFLKNLDHPSYSLNVSGNADLFEISKLTDLGNGFGMSGLAQFDIQMKGRITDFDSITASEIRSIKGLADLKLREVVIRIKGLPSFENIRSDLKVGPKDVYIANFSASIANSKTTGTAKLHNWLDYVLKKSKRLDITGDIRTEALIMSDWVNESEENKRSTPKVFPEFLSYSGHVEIGTFKDQEIIFTQLRSDITYFPSTLKLSNTYFSGFNGAVYANIKLSEWVNGFGVHGQLTTKNIDIREVLRINKNFGFDFISYKEIKGALHSSIDFDFTTNKAFVVDKSSVIVDGDVMLLNGELIENKLLYSIPKEVESNKIISLFVNLDLFEERLHHIKFDTISNHISIKNEVISIPGMTLKSSAINIGVQGTHTFSNEMDYYMNFNLNNVLGKKEPITDAYGFIEDDEKGNRNMYLHVYTKKGQLVVDVDKFGSKKIVNLPQSHEMKVVKSILKEEIGLFKKDTSVVVEPPVDTFDYEVDLGEFGEADTLANEKQDTPKKDSTILGKILKKKKKKKKDDFEEWDVEEDDF